MATISDKIYIDTENECPVPQELLADCTYKNPEYYQKMNMGLSVYKIEKQIKTYEVRGDTVAFARGEYQKVVHQIPGIKWELNFPNHPIDLQYVNNDFEMDDYQKEAVVALQKQNQGVLHAVTSAGKSIMILKAICEMKQRAIIIVHRKLLMKQFIADIEKYVRDKDGNPITIGIIGNGKLSIGDITIAIDKTLSKNMEKYKDQFGVVFMDEVHLAPTKTMYEVINTMQALRRYGASGTLRRKDQKEFLIFALFGPVVYEITKEQLLAKNRVVPVNIHILESDARFDYESVIEAEGVSQAHVMVEKFLGGHAGRKKVILDAVAKLPGKTIVLSRHVAPCIELQKELREQHGITAGVITGKDAKMAERAYEAMKHGDLRVIFATVGCVATGVSISDLDNIVLISPIYTNELLLHQIRGRGMRCSPGKTECNLFFVWDFNIFDRSKLARFQRIMDM